MRVSRGHVALASPPNRVRLLDGRAHWRSRETRRLVTLGPASRLPSRSAVGVTPATHNHAPLQDDTRFVVL